LRASYEEGIPLRREPIVDMINDPNVDEATRAKLRLVLMVREFATGLGLAVGGSYRTYATVGPDQKIYALSAVPHFELELYTWWFPFVGRMPYKGFFSEADARDEAHTLDAEGYDTMVVPVAAFSTLGWFDDPLPSNLLRHDEVTIAAIVLHELTHNTWYAPNNATFNESFANFVGGRGAIDFFAAIDFSEAREPCARRGLWHDDVLYSRFLDALTQRPRREYAPGINLEQRRAIFTEELQSLAALPWQNRCLPDMDKVKLNNALILQQQVYHRELPLFDAAFEREHDDLRRTISAIIEAATPADDPYAALRQLAAQG
jgi:predicted aminopeptidase